jgi:elongation factor Ts
MDANLIKQLRDLTGAGFLDCKKALDASKDNLDAAVAWLRTNGVAKAEKKATRIAAEGLAYVHTEGDYGILLEVNSETDFVAKNPEFISAVEEIGKAIFAAGKTKKPETAKIGKLLVKDYLLQLSGKIGEKLDIRRYEIVKKTPKQYFGTYLHSNSKIAAITISDSPIAELNDNLAMQVAALNPKYLTYADISKEDIEAETKIQSDIVLTDEKLASKPKAMLTNIIDAKVKKQLAGSVLELQVYIQDDSLSFGQYLTTNKAKVVSIYRYEVGEGMEKRVDDFLAEVAKQAK